MRLRSLLAAVLIATAGSLLLSPVSPAAACWLAVTFDEAVASAEYIVTGRISSGGDPYWFEEPGGAGSGPTMQMIITPLCLTVVESLKGPAAPGDTLTIGQLGGKIGDLVVWCSAERYLGQGFYLLFLCSSQGLWAGTGLRVSQEWLIAGSSLVPHWLWPEYRTLTQVKVEIERILSAEAAGTSPGIAAAAAGESGEGGELAGEATTSAGKPGGSVPGLGRVLVASAAGGWALRRAAGRGVVRKRR